TCMTQCGSCLASAAPGSRYCASCGAVLAMPTGSPTVAMPKRYDERPDEDLFAPGALFSGRYRIAGRLGSGGMGVVYRADDLTLSQPVALKFLSRKTVGDANFLARFHGEVRIARQVSHPNVCRVYDIGVVDGATYISMEY